MKSTRECSRVYFDAIGPHEKIAFEKRQYVHIPSFEFKPFKSSPDIDINEIEAMLKSKERQLRELKDAEQATKPRRLLRCKTPWATRIDQKRQFVAQMLQSQDQLNLAEVCRKTGCSYGLVKRVYSDLLFMGRPGTYTVPNEKPIQTVAALDNSIAQIQGTYMTISDLKRQHPSFSRRWIARRMKRTGLRYHLMTKKTKVSKRDRYTKKEVLQIVCHLAQVLANDDKVDSYYVDEVHFPLNQTSARHWTIPDQPADDLLYNRRPVNDVKLSAIAMCDLKGFVAVQIYLNDIRSEDFLFFMQQALSSVPRKNKVTVLADNASWHRAANISSAKAIKYLHFNAPGLFLSNAIENSFSFVRSAFRKRPLVSSLEEEAHLLVNIFYDRDNEKRFHGIARNHIRSLLYLLRHNHMMLATGNDSDED